MNLALLTTQGHQTDLGSLTVRVKTGPQMFLNPGVAAADGVMVERNLTEHLRTEEEIIPARKLLISKRA